METLHGLSEGKTKLYAELVGRLCALALNETATVDRIKEIAVDDGYRSIMLSAFGTYLSHGTDAAMKELQDAVRKLPE